MSKKKKIPPGIYERGSRWRVDTYYKGQQLKDSFATPEMAEENLRKMKTLIDEGKYLEKKRVSQVTFGEFKTRYITWIEQIGQKTAYDKKLYLVPLTAHFGENTLLHKITRADVEEYQAKRKSLPGKRVKEIKPATVNREMATLKHLFSKAVEWKVLTDSPARGIKMLKESNRRLRFLSADECKSLLDACPITKLKKDESALPILRWIVTLALNTGMRKGEILNLKWENVHLRESYLELTDQKNGERSTIPLNEAAVAILRAIPRRIDTPYVFPGRFDGQPFSDLKRQFEKAVTAAELKDMTFHTLRHTAASHLVMAGVDLATVKEILRHKSISMTLRYAHLSPDHKKSAVEALSKALTVKVEKADKTA
jgi:integrase